MQHESGDEISSLRHCTTQKYKVRENIWMLQKDYIELYRLWKVFNIFNRIMLQKWLWWRRLSGWS
jgi:hypothetical protein